MKQYLCDKCHCNLVPPLYFKLKQTNPWNNVPDKKFHLCENCYSDFCDFIRQKGEKKE